MILLLLACAKVPEPCLALCDDFVAQEERCLTARGLDWPATGYADAEEARASCETWAWEMELLARDAGCAGVVEQECLDRQDLLGQVDCPDELDWNDSPTHWESCDG